MYYFPPGPLLVCFWLASGLVLVLTQCSIVRNGVCARAKARLLVFSVGSVFPPGSLVLPSSCVLVLSAFLVPTSCLPNLDIRTHCYCNEQSKDLFPVWSSLTYEQNYHYFQNQLARISLPFVLLSIQALRLVTILLPMAGLGTYLSHQDFFSKSCLCPNE